ncbi:MAG: hypothetical protein VKK07_10590 [Merismopediaceae bacterium]|nr:hypothetical protein [Merismopediaceae bacterium]
MSVDLAYINLIVDLVIICATIQKADSWGEWITGTILYLPGAMLSGYPANMVGMGGETAILVLWSPLVLLIVRAKIEMTKPPSPASRKFRKATDLEVILGTFIVFTCMMLSIWIEFYRN